jgi:phosphatidylserine/phosphatidylglycerophosphate/cardiolipin synthase-like enzyme
MSRSLIVMPDDSAKPILEAIEGAKKSLRVKMFLFSDPTLLQAVNAAKKRGVKVRIMLNPARRDGESENTESRKKLDAGGVEIIDSSPEFDVPHEKSWSEDPYHGASAIQAKERKAGRIRWRDAHHGRCRHQDPQTTTSQAARQDAARGP